MRSLCLMIFVGFAASLAAPGVRAQEAEPELFDYLMQPGSQLSYTIGYKRVVSEQKTSLLHGQEASDEGAEVGLKGTGGDASAFVEVSFLVADPGPRERLRLTLEVAGVECKPALSLPEAVENVLRVAGDFRGRTATFALYNGGSAFVPVGDSATDEVKPLVELVQLCFPPLPPLSLMPGDTVQFQGRLLTFREARGTGRYRRAYFSTDWEEHAGKSVKGLLVSKERSRQMAKMVLHLTAGYVESWAVRRCFRDEDVTDETTRRHRVTQVGEDLFWARLKRHRPPRAAAGEADEEEQDEELRAREEAIWDLVELLEEEPAPWEAEETSSTPGGNTLQGSGGDSEPQESGQTETLDEPTPPRDEYITFGGIKTRATHVIFVLDTSSSMGEPMVYSIEGGPKGDATLKLDWVKKKFHATMKDLSEEVFFGVVFYAQSATAWTERPVQATPDNKERALLFVDARVPRGSTNFVAGFTTALHMVLRIPSKQRAKENFQVAIYVLTDGLVKDVGVLLARLEQLKRKFPVVVHVLSRVENAELKQLAEGTGGEFKQW